MARIPFISLARIIADAGFPGGTSQAIAIAVVAAESDRNPVARFTNTDGSIDRGLWQINNVWHAEVSDTEADDPIAATKHALRISAQGTSFNPWSAFKNGSYKVHSEAAAVALDGLARERALQAELERVRAQLQLVKNGISKAIVDLSVFA
jgi:hypothetical protein